MGHIDYPFYTDEYLKGKEPKVSQGYFGFYDSQAEAIIKEMTHGRSDTYIDGNEVKMATCAAMEQIYAAIGESTENDDADVIPAGVSSEKVGDYSVTYLNNSQEERMQTARKTAMMAARVYLGQTGLLFSGIRGMI